MTVYLDTSAAAKLLVDENESPALVRRLDSLADDVRIVSSMLLETELRRLGVREELPQPLISELLERVDLVEPNRAIFRQAGLLPGARLRSLDALHLATALAMDCDELLVYDNRLADSAAALGLRVSAPA